MLTKPLKVLGIDDHPIVLEGYNFMFRNLESQHERLDFVKAVDCRSAQLAVQQHSNEHFDLAIIDYSIPALPEEKLFSGKDIALLIRENMPGCKIIMMTMHRELDIVFSIINTVKPQGFINKSDCDTDELMQAFANVLKGETFYSSLITKYSNMIQKGMVLEEVDVKIMRFLARGVEDRNITSYIPLTYKEIESRKNNIKNVLGVEGNDQELIEEARAQGYI
ncbi:response regulator [Flavobacterium sp. Sd200]|uniref:response regulator n=1 Tax=Flavobacterium sp. Sd200 TaxID=2692211 RepID=UPI0013680F4D|nr:response regulator [Flavobacterium sp. Sd200]MXN91858.1 response regulator [Flavobacterium sp. Sd200]